MDDTTFYAFLVDYHGLRDAQRGYFKGKSPTLAECKRLEAALDKWAAELLRTLKGGGTPRTPLTLFDPDTPPRSA